MNMEPPGSMQDGGDGDGVVNMTRAMEALFTWLKHPRKTIIRVEGLVLAAAALLLFQLIMGFCKRLWHKSIFNSGAQMSAKLMNLLIIYTLGTMQSSPIKNSAYPVWAAFLIMASTGTDVARQYDFYGSWFSKSVQAFGECLRDLFYVMMFSLLMDPNTYTWKTALDLKRHLKNPRTSSGCVSILVYVILFTKMFQSFLLAILGYKQERNPFVAIINIIRRRQGVAEWSREESGNDHGACDDSSDPRSMKGYKYAVCYRRLCGAGPSITIDQIWDKCVSSADGEELKDLCLSYAFFRRLMRQRYFGEVYRGTSLLEDRDFVFKKLLPSEGDFRRAFKIIEAELGFCSDFFFTKYYYSFVLMNSPVPFIQCLFLFQIIMIFVVGVFTFRKQLVLETPDPIIEVHILEADYIITLLLLIIALIVGLLHSLFYLASNWAQLSLACMHVKKHWYEPAIFFGKATGFLRRHFRISRALRNTIDQHSFIFQQKHPAVEVSDAVKTAIARSLISTYSNNLKTIGETSPWQNQMFEEYSWALKHLSQLEVMLIWHIATEYCDAISGDRSDGNGTTPRNSIAQDGHRGVAVHLSRYCAYLIQSISELLPYHKTDIAELAQEVMDERQELYGSDYSLAWNRMIQQEVEHDDPREMFQKGVKLGKKLVMRMQDDRWEVLKDFWAETTIHAAASHYTTKQHMQHLENGGEFLTHIWALLSHAGILNLKRGKDQGSSGTSAAA